MEGVEKRRIDLAELVARERIKTVQSLKVSIESLQERIIDGMVNRGWKRAGTYNKQLVTMLGELTFRVIKVWRGDVTTSPVLDVLSIRKVKYSREVRMVLADMAARLSYNDSRVEFRRMTGISVPKRTIYSFVQEIGPQLSSSHGGVKDSIVVMADGTETRSVYSMPNEVRVAISIGKHGERGLLGVVVNKTWDSVPKPQGPYTLVSDAGRGIRNSLANNQDDVQLDLMHAVKETMFKLWGEGMNKEERDEVSREMKRILFTLVNSVKKHGEDGDIKAIEKRVVLTLMELRDLAKSLWRRGYRKASAFIVRNAKLMVTFAQLACIGLHIPYTSNLIERMMGEIAKRCKHKWAHWSTQGLENMLWILLTRYTDPQHYEAFWNRYIHPSSMAWCSQHNSP